jgi:uncharacterized protein YdhG (YjbR/CyaY superfamily)
MAKSAATMQEYLDALPPERRAVVAAVRDVILEHLPLGYQESFQNGMISYVIPLERYPETYNRQPLTYLTLAAQKNHYALYLMSVYQDPEQEAWLRDQFARAGKKFDMGKSCLRFRRLNDLPLDAIGRLVAQTSPDAFITRYETIRQRVR